MSENETEFTGPIEGRANALGTKRLADRFKMDGVYNRMAGLSWSSIGLGTYLGEMDDATDQAVENAVTEAYTAGINVFDTAIGYRGQRAERSIGRALTKLLPTKPRRAEVILSTKAGIVPVDGESNPDAMTYIRDTYVKPGIVDDSDILMGTYCYTPDYLEFSIDQSLTNLNANFIDIFYLHNPEFVKPMLGETKFKQMIKDAFTRMEELVVKGKIGYYGIATWVGLRTNPKHQGSLQLEEIVDIAKSIAGTGHHFRYVMAPFSLMMLEAMELETQKVEGKYLPLVDAAKELVIGLVGSSPLAGGNLVSRWGGVSENNCELVKGMSPMQQALQFVRSVPGFATILSGMKSPQHLAENLNLFKNSQLWQPEEMVEFMSAADE